MKKHFYPRACEACRGTYSDRSNFGRHKRNGVCERKQENTRAEAEVDNVVGALDALKIDHTSQNVYIVQMCHHISTGEDVFKCGRSQYSVARLKDYPRGSKLLATLPVTNMREAEKQLLVTMAANFKKREDHGCEFFEGSLPDIMNVFVSVAQKFALRH